MNLCHARIRKSFRKFFLRNRQCEALGNSVLAAPSWADDEVRDVSA